jgi:site-specific recombinase XerD
VQQASGLVFTGEREDQLDKDTVPRAFRKVVATAGLDARKWSPRELRHTFVSVLSDDEMPLEKISRLVHQHRDDDHGDRVPPPDMARRPARR